MGSAQTCLFGHLSWARLATLRSAHSLKTCTLLICHLYGWNRCGGPSQPRSHFRPWITQANLVILSLSLTTAPNLSHPMSLNTAVRIPFSNPRATQDGLVRHSLFSSRTTLSKPRQQHMLVVEAKGKKGMQSRQFQKPPPLPKIEDDGNPKFVIFIRMANVYLWYPLSLITGGTTAKIMVAAKDTFLGKYIYKDTIARNLAAVIYRDEKEIQKTAVKQFRVLRTATEFRYGYKLVENGNVRSALSNSDVIELPTPDQLKTVVDKVKDFFGDAKESFGKIRALNSSESDDSEENYKRQSKVKS